MPDEKQLPTNEHDRQALLRLVQRAGASHLPPGDMAVLLKISDDKLQQLMQEDAEFAHAYRYAHLQRQMVYFDVVDGIATDPENKQQLNAAKYLYELFSGREKTNRTVIAIQNISQESEKAHNNLKLIEALDVKTIEQISHD